MLIFQLLQVFMNFAPITFNNLAVFKRMKHLFDHFLPQCPEELENLEPFFT